jgi:hypothetical protein
MSMTRSVPSLLRPLTLLTLLLLAAEFLIGMVVNLYVQIPAAHPGANASQYFPGVVQGVGWALTLSPLALLVHVVLGLLLMLDSSIIVGCAIASRRMSCVRLSILGWMMIVGAGFNGASFLNYRHNFSSMMMSSQSIVATAAYILCFVLAETRSQRNQGQPGSSKEIAPDANLRG